MTDSKTPDWAAHAADKVGEDIYGRHERGFIMWPLISESGTPLRDAVSQALLSVYERGRKEREWQDISTAPKDGTVVLGYWPSSALPEGYTQPVRYDGLRGWIIHWDLGSAYPTLWMPLPAPQPYASYWR